jgi:DNA-binding transcriptional MerR regulator/effector-binding domain-containing protein
VSGSLTIGEFSRLTHLTVKALRHYHDVGLLEPAGVDGSSGYRRYDTSQVATAQLVKRLRELEMPLPVVRAVLAAPDGATRNAAIAAHLERMERQLERTRDVVASLRALLAPPVPTGHVELRHVEAALTLAIREHVSRDNIARWCGTAFPQLYAVAERTGATVTGPAGGIYGPEFFESGAGEVTAFVPVEGGASDGDVRLHMVPAVDLAVLLHLGPFTDLDITYGALGSYATEHGIAATGPIREYYLAGPDDVADQSGYRTEVGWPVHPGEGD